MKTYLALFAAGCIAGAVVNGWRWSADMSELKSTHTAELASITNAAAKAEKQLQQDLDDNEKLWATAEEIQYRTLRNAQNEINQLRSDVATGRKRLLVNATCPASSDKLPEASADSGMGERAAPRLTKDAEPYYYTLVEQMTTMTAQLRYYQARCQ
ncbi:MAG TPA: lysis protein [Methylophaga aminisulfidivorans]|uniref:Lysis protein n=2 Tax=root TaxID=1 RepID=A0A7C1W1L2_9GAMM|nr:lysis protein [Methylophaga aminisulfidivorans]